MFKSFWLFGIFCAVAARPTRPERRFLESINVADDVLVFDGAGFPDPAGSGQIIAAIQAFVSVRAINLSPVTAGIESLLSGLGIDIGDNLSTIQSRLKLLGAIPLPGKEVVVNIDGCSQPANLGGTSGLPDLGMTLGNISVGTCTSSVGKVAASVNLSSIDSRKISANIFFSKPDGFGVISDIDDTVKISNVLDKPKLIKATLIDDPQVVAGMPALYSSLTKSLSNPSFFYVSGSPFQLYPFLHDFIADNYPQGPILLRNLTLVDIPGLIDFTGANDVQEYKTEMIDRIKGMYPAKKFLAVGDSTEKDPETYGASFLKYGPSTISCIWIHKVDLANNTDARFAAAFQGVPAERYRVFTDADIPGLAAIDVAGGKC